jgi:3-oxoacyl-[acyl-carrier protein] reductase
MIHQIHCIFVTGASSGIGLGITKKLLQFEKYYVVGIDKADASGEIFQEHYLHIKSDLSKFEEIKGAVNEIIKKHDFKVKGLINAAGIMPSMLFSKLDPKKVVDTFAINSIAPIYLSKLLLRHLSNSRPAFIINVTSIAADINIPGEGVYSASKAALKVITEYMSIEYARFGVSVNAIAPALVETPMTAHLTVDQVKYMRKKQALHIDINVNDVAEAIELLINAPLAVTGSTLYVGGINK